MKKLIVLVILLVGVLESNAQVDSIHVYPNPFQDTVNVTLYGLDSTTLQYKVYNVSGVLVLQSSLGTVSGDVSFTVVLDSLSLEGVYFLRIVTQSKSYNYKIVKIPPAALESYKASDVSLYGYDNKVYITGARDGTVTIFNLSGQQVHESRIQSGVGIITVRHKGTYLVRLITSNGMMSKKIYLE
ncbi:MAG: T9SS type A sorting domain-containing protein [Bacteroidetes bacterium]|nr:T9SS type A sorting domain-containing protein [Bacteroidota bacterium]